MPETKWYELTTVPILPPPATLGGEEVEELAVKLRLGRREKWEEDVFDFFLISHYPTV